MTKLNTMASAELARRLLAAHESALVDIQAVQAELRSAPHMETNHYLCDILAQEEERTKADIRRWSNFLKRREQIA